MAGAGLGIYIGLRYLSGKGGRVLSGASIASMAGLALGVAVLILVMSVMNGFREEISNRLLGVIPHVEAIHSDLLEIPAVLAVPEVRGAARFLRFEALLRPDHTQNHAVSVFAVEPEKEALLNIIPKHVVAGQWQALASSPNSIVLGRPLARYLDLRLNDRFKLLVLNQPKGTQIPQLVEVSFRLAALFEVGAEVDYSLAFIDLDSARQQIPASAYSGGWRLQLHDPVSAPAQAALLTAQIAELTGVSNIQVQTWANSFGALFQAIRLEKNIMFLLLFLIILIAAFSVASVQVLAVDEKRSAVAILNTMGMSKSGIALIFLAQALVVGLTGIITGTIAGVFLAQHIDTIMAWVGQYLGFQMLQGTYFDRLPSRWQWDDLALISATTLILTLLSTLYPAWQATKVRPAAVLNAV